MIGITYRTFCPIKDCQWTFDYGFMTALALVDRVCETHLSEEHPESFELIRGLYDTLECL